jgi:endonuclease/exonuclease/phosphatase (EEP) superfamily protein YafD
MVDVIVERRRFKLLAVHFRKPYESEHGEEFLAITRATSELRDTIVIGDFNTTPWAAQFRNLQRDAELNHARAGFGLHNSFGLSRWKLVPIPIDHMLYKGAIGIESFEVLPWVSSDHRPIRASFLLGTPRGRKARSDD